MKQRFTRKYCTHFQPLLKLHIDAFRFVRGVLHPVIDRENRQNPQTQTGGIR